MLRLPVVRGRRARCICDKLGREGGISDGRHSGWSRGRGPRSCAPMPVGGDRHPRCRTPAMTQDNSPGWRAGGLAAEPAYDRSSPSSATRPTPSASMTVHSSQELPSAYANLEIDTPIGAPRARLATGTREWIVLSSISPAERAGGAVGGTVGFRSWCRQQSRRRRTASRPFCSPHRPCEFGASGIGVGNIGTCSLSRPAVSGEDVDVALDRA